MLSPEIKQALQAYASKMTQKVTFVLQTGEHPKRAELLEFLTGIAETGDLLALEERDTQGKLRSPISFTLEAGDKPTGITFSGIPSGHEFNSLVLAYLQASGTEIKLDESVQNIVTSVDETLNFEVFVSLSCHNCPDVVQAINQFALLNDNISTEMIDGGLFQEVIEERNIQGVPTVYLNGELLANGKIDTAKLIEKLVEKHPSILEKSQKNPTENLPVQDVTVIGGGPAGVAAAIYAARKGLAVTVIADRVGGQVKDTMGIENFISVVETTGPKLSQDMLTHLQEHDITLREHFKVEKIEKGDIKRLHLSSGEQIETKTLIIATGAKWRELGVPGEKENIGNGVAYCPHCDGPFFKDKDVAVIGGGNSGIEAAIDLAGIVKSVTVFEFMPELKADKVLVDSATKRDNIRIIKNAATEQVLAESSKVTGLQYQDRATEESHVEPFAGIFVQIGLVPNSQFLDGVVELSKFGEVIVNERCETSEPGIFACGDVTTVPYKQIIIAMGEGSKASLTAFEYLIKNF
ncbi:MAG: alkyl hydroperoxide reductase subunit F [Pseudomonadota bacterium]|nr:alkyl hydroperoxide reductase subunit F [Pseudomonadota bacterium]